MTSLRWPLVRNYPFPLHFRHEDIDLFYDLVECLHRLVFVKQINPYTGRPYLHNARIVYMNFEPNVNDEDTDLSRFVLRVSYDLVQTTPNPNTIPCELNIGLLPTWGRGSAKPYVYSTFGDDYYNRPGRYMHCLNGHVYMNVEACPYIQSGDREMFVALFEIWLTISKNDKYIDHVASEYEYKYYEYLKNLIARDHFMTTQMQAMGNIFIPRLAPFHQERPYLTQTLSEPLIFNTVRGQGRESFFTDFLHKYFSK